MDLIDHLIAEGWLKTPEIIEAFRNVRRPDFISEDFSYRFSQDLALKNEIAQIDEPLSIGYGQTISQPAVVAFMLELLSPMKGNTVLDIGSGSGWTTALLSHIVGEKGKVIAMEVIPALKEFGEKNADKYGFVKRGIARFIAGDGSKGYMKEAPFDAILVSASAEKIFDSWKDQLTIGGRIVASWNQGIVKLVKRSKTDFTEEFYPGFLFVPLIEQ